MKITYTGRHIGLAPSQTAELEEEFGKISKLLDTQRGEGEARVILKHEHNANQVEVRVSWRHHEVVGESEHADLFTAVHAAIGKASAQVVHTQQKTRDLKRTPVH